MSENQPESTTPNVTVEADEAVVNTAPDGGGVDNNNEAPATDEAPAKDEAGSDSE